MVIWLREMPAMLLKGLTMCGDTHTNFPSVSQGKNNSLSTNDRGVDIKRATEELSRIRHVHAEYLARHAGPDAPEFYRLLWTALTSPNLLPTEKIIYALCLAERQRFTWSNERIATLARVSVSTVQRAFRSLEREGMVEKHLRSDNTSVRTFRQAPVEPAIARLAAELHAQQPKREPVETRRKPQGVSPMPPQGCHPCYPTSDIYTSEKKDKRASNTRGGSIVGERPEWAKTIRFYNPALKVNRRTEVIGDMFVTLFEPEALQ
jgi:hypothetical protein